jgi:hypothetical protein
MLGDTVQNSVSRYLCTPGCKYIIQVNDRHAVVLNSEIVSVFLFLFLNSTKVEACQFWAEARVDHVFTLLVR